MLKCSASEIEIHPHSEGKMESLLVAEHVEIAKDSGKISKT